MKREKYFTGSGFWLGFWILGCWPIGMWYWYAKLKTIKEIKEENKKK